MFDIGKYLGKFKRMSESRDFLRNTVSDVINEVCKIEINPKSIDVKSGIVRINERPIIKSEIFINKTKILSTLARRIQENIIDIV